ncbi:hypothetical protein BUALT_Bualt14G0034100 [Buddleja alternifolia]|uniref:DUF4283 domain-containing protein n=1 Tax=Buddleja alternifolia TaxID=168488 RepID=A0AAV6WL77_9LAMI|nr:hypothetical protein BUALT_Bualt14G0034100 [Buddleja alternifolia]
MEPLPPPPADLTADLTANSGNSAPPLTYAKTLQGNNRPQELAARAARKSFVYGVDSNVNETSTSINGKKTIFLSKEEDNYILRAKFATLGLLKGFKIGVLDNKHVWIRQFDSNDYTRIWLKRACIISKPLKLDEATSEIENPAVARICVEINVMEKLQSEIPVQVEGKTSLLRIQYEGILEYCRICRHRGHTMASCLAQKENKEIDDTVLLNQEINVEQVWREKGDLQVRLDKMRGKKPIETPTLILPRGADLEVFIKENNGKKRGNNEADEQDDRISQETNKDGHEGKNKSETIKEVSSTENYDQNSIGMGKETPGSRMENSDIGLDMGDEAQNKLTSFLEESRQMVQLGYEVQVPNTEDESQESENNESGEDIWHEVTKKKHRQATSLDGEKRKSHMKALLLESCTKKHGNVMLNLLTFLTLEYIEMLVLDGCFIIELVRKFNMECLRDRNDVLFEMEWIINSLQRDLMLFENQIPFSVPRDTDERLIFLLLSFFANMKKTETWKFIQSARKLREANVKFKSSKSDSFFKIEFENGVLSLPHLIIEDRTQDFFRNVIAYEQYLQEKEISFVTDYVKFMDCLIDSSRDVKILCRYGFIESWLGDDEMIANMFNKLTESVTGPGERFIYAGTCTRVNKHFSKRKNWWMKILRLRYCDSPWKVISIVAATLLLLLTFIPTVCSIKQVN